MFKKYKQKLSSDIGNQIAQNPFIRFHLVFKKRALRNNPRV